MFLEKSTSKLLFKALKASLIKLLLYKFTRIAFIAQVTKLLLSGEASLFSK